jgi:DNA-binding NtrC family response regulator
MTFVNAEEQAQAAAISRLGHCNPFLPERIENERTILGAEFAPTDAVWTVRADREVQNPNVARIKELAAALVGRLRERLVAGVKPSEAERLSYADAVLYLLYTRYEDELLDLVLGGAAGSDAGRVPFFHRFAADCAHWLDVPGVRLPSDHEPAHLFACLFQVRRAFHHIFWHLIGGSMPMARLRAAVWQSIFTHDMRRYRRTLYARMDDITTLVAGPSGTGKELVARAIAMSRYIPFDAKSQRFAASFADLFHPLNLSALSPTLIESELFGHQRGAFTGALQDRAGWFETCEPLGTVFLDEIGDVDPSIQVKLLRVLQTRTFQRLGDTKELRFRGKIIAATNRDLAAEIRAGRFREDFYYRLCSDIIHTPTLGEQLRESPRELADLIGFIARRVVGEPEAPALADEVHAWIDAHLGNDYPWPGNVRELEQCVRNVLIRGEYRPSRTASNAGDELAAAMSAGTLTADDVLARYCTLVYAQTGSYQETARRLGLDRRTVKSKVDPAELRRIRGTA